MVGGERYMGGSRGRGLLRAFFVGGRWRWLGNGSWVRFAVKAAVLTTETSRTGKVLCIDA